MADIIISINSNSPAEIAKIKADLQSIATNFSKENRAEIAKLSQLDNANERIQKLFSNPLFKMACRS
jgi:hypothetical protein